MSLKAKLKMAGKIWNEVKSNVKAGGGSFTEIEDGRYVAQLTKAEVGESKSKGRLQIGWSYTVLDGDFKGKSGMGFDGLETPENLTYGVGPKILALGYELPDKLEDIEEILGELTEKKPFVRIRLKTKPGSDFQNLYFDEVLEKEEVEELVGEVSSAPAKNSKEEETEEETESEEEAEEEVEEEVEEEEQGTVLAVGKKVDFTFKGETKSGTILSLNEEEETAKIKVDREGKVFTVKFEKIEIPTDVPEEPEVEEEEDEEEEEEVSKVAKAKVAKKEAKVQKVSRKK